MKKNSMIIISLIIAVVIMAAAYAAFSTTLTVNGSGSISSVWKTPIITSCSCSATTSTDTVNPPTATCTPVSNGTTSIGTISASMVLPGDLITCTFKTANNGTLHAGVPTISITGATSTITAVGQNGTCIKAGGTGSFQIKVTYLSEGSTTTNLTATASYSQVASCS